MLYYKVYIGLIYFFPFLYIILDTYSILTLARLNMYNIGDYIIYGNSGVCKVITISKAPIEGLNPERDYYTLQPIFDSVMIYVPIDTEVFMRPLMTVLEVEDLLRKIPDIKVSIISTNNSTELAGEYRKLINSHKSKDLVRLIKSIKKKNVKAEKEGRRIGLTDMRFLKQAEELFFGELSIILDIPIENVSEYVLKKTKCQDIFDPGSVNLTRKDDHPAEKRSINDDFDLTAPESTDDYSDPLF